MKEYSDRKDRKKLKEFAKIFPSRSLLLLLSFATAALVISVLNIEIQAGLIILILMSFHTAMLGSIQVETAKRKELSNQLFEARVLERLSVVERQLTRIESSSNERN